MIEERKAPHQSYSLMLERVLTISDRRSGFMSSSSSGKWMPSLSWRLLFMSPFWFQICSHRSNSSPSKNNLDLVLNKLGVHESFSAAISPCPIPCIHATELSLDEIARTKEASIPLWVIWRVSLPSDGERMRRTQTTTMQVLSYQYALAFIPQPCEAHAQAGRLIPVQSAHPSLDTVARTETARSNILVIKSIISDSQMIITELAMATWQREVRDGRLHASNMDLWSPREDYWSVKCVYPFCRRQ